VPFDPAIWGDGARLARATDGNGLAKHGHSGRESFSGGNRESVTNGTDSDFQQIQRGQQIGMLDGTAFGRTNLWLTGAVAGFCFIVNKHNLLASLNLLERKFLFLRSLPGGRPCFPFW
jgi:hypothetical protein